MIDNGFEFYFHWRKTFDVMIMKRESAEDTFSYDFTTFFVPITTVVKLLSL